MFIVQTSAAKMPASCWGRYRRVAVLEVEGPVIPKMLSERAKGVVRVVKIWDKLYAGKTDRCAFQKACAEAQALATELNVRERKNEAT